MPSQKPFSSILAAGLGMFMLAAAAPASWAEEKEDEGEDGPSLPLEGETGRLELALNEGTWLSLDVSPDGQTMVFELLGDLYRVSVKGGAAEQLTSGLGYDSQPRLSPDGASMAFISDRDGNDNLWIADSDGGNPRKVSSLDRTRIVSPEWSADGSYIAVTEIGKEPRLAIYFPDGGSGMSLQAGAAGGDDAEDIDGLGVVFSPDGRFAYYAAPENGGYPGAQIHRLDMRTGLRSPLTQLAGGGFRPAVSPDGRYLAYITRDEAVTRMRLRDLVTGADRQLVVGLQRDAQEQRRAPSRDYFPGYAFAPDGKSIILNHDGAFARVDVATGKVEAIPFTAKVALDIGPDLTAPYRADDGPVRARIIHSPVLSPDGKRIAASVLGALYVMPTSGEAVPRRISPEGLSAYVPTWSPDGRHLAFASWSDMEGGQIWRIASDGNGAPRQLTQHAAYYTDLDWSPDGATIVGMRGSEWIRHRTFSEFGGLDTPMEFIRLPADGGDVSVVRPAEGGERDPHFAGGNERIYAYSGDALISMLPDGGDQLTHLEVKVPTRGPRDEDNHAEQIRMRPGGGWAVALGNGQVWVTPIPQLGAAVASVSVRGAATPIARLTSIGADFVGWSADGSEVHWAIGSTFYRRPFDTLTFSKDTDETEDAGVPEDHSAVMAQPFIVEKPRTRPNGALLLTGATIITMAGEDTREMAKGLPDTDILIVDNRIESIGPKGSLDLPSAAEIVDVSGQFIMPGLIDTHAHWEFRTQDVLEPHNWSLAANLAYGVTAGLDVQTSHKDYFTYRDFVDAGITVGQRAFMTGKGVFGDTDFQSYERTHAYLRRYKEHYRTNNIKAYLTGNRQQRQWVVQASEELELLPTTEGGADMRLDLTHAIDGMHGNEHTLPILPLRDDVLQLYAKTQTAYTATLLVQYQAISAVNYFFTTDNPHNDEKLARFYPENRVDVLSRRRRTWALEEEYAFKQAAASVAALQRAGGLVGIGGHGELQGLGYHWEMRAHAMGGMTPAEIMRAATIDGARIIGIEQDLGSLEPGKLADLIVLDADPREAIENAAAIDKVMKGGELYDGDTLTRVWPSEKKLPPFWWTESPD